MKLASQALRIGIAFASLGLAADNVVAADIGTSSSSKAQVETPDQARCKAMGDGYFAVKGSSACVKISGYISAGVGFLGPGRIAAPTTGPFASHAAPYSTEEGAVAIDTQFDTELGPGRLYVQVGGSNFNH